MADQKFELHVRAYAPFDTFGGIFHGDGKSRRASTAKNATARVAAWVAFDPNAGTYGKAAAKSDPSKMVHTGLVKTGRPSAIARAVKTGRGIFIQLDAWGANPLAPGAPDIDVRVMADLAIVDGMLCTSMSLSGDLFPNFEVFVADQSDKRKMVLAYETDGGRTLGPMVRLWGNRQADMGGICACFQVTADGLFL